MYALNKRSCYYQLRQLRVIARSLTFDAAVSLIRAFEVSRLDYCGSIFTGLPGVRIEKMRWIHSMWLRRNSLAGSPRLSRYPNICGKYCTGFLSYNASHTAVVPKLFGLRTPFEVKYFSRSHLRKIYSDLEKLQCYNIEEHAFVKHVMFYKHVLVHMKKQCTSV